MGLPNLIDKRCIKISVLLQLLVQCLFIVYPHLLLIRVFLRLKCIRVLEGAQIPVMGIRWNFGHLRLVSNLRWPSLHIRLLFLKSEVPQLVIVY